MHIFGSDDRVCQQKEFERMVKVYESHKLKMPSKRAFAKKAEQIHKLTTQPVTESDIAAILARKNANKPTAASVTLERSRLNQARTLAIRRQDFTELADIDAQLALLVPVAPAIGAGRDEDASAILARVNERNRKANLEQVRKAELAESERKRRERKLAVMRSKSRLGTPGTPLLDAESTTPARTASPLPPSALAGSAKPQSKGSFQASVIRSVEIDLGDF